MNNVTITRQINLTQGLVVEGDTVLKGNGTEMAVNQVHVNTSQDSAPETIIVTVDGSSFYLDGTEKDTLYLSAGTTYVFDTTALSGHELAFSETSDGTHNSGVEYTTGVTTGDNVLELSVTSTTPTLYYYCKQHSNMGGTLFINVLHVTASQRGDVDLSVLNTIAPSSPPPVTGTTDAEKLQSLLTILANAGLITYS